MDDTLLFSLSIAGAYGCALAAWPILRWRGRTSVVFSTCGSVVVLFAPLLIPAGMVGARALAAFLCIDLTFKMLDYSRQHRHRRRDAVRFAGYARFLIPFPVLSVVFGQRERRLPIPRPRQKDVIGVLLAAALFAAAFGLVHAVSRIGAVKSSFLIDHTVKIAIFMLAIEALCHMLYGLERLAGFDTKPLIQNAFLSPTVAEFWCRFNTRVHAWYDLNIFRPTGGRRASARGVVLSFFISAALHELMFGIATSRFDGYQFAFFMLQAPAVLASRRLHRLAARGGTVGKSVARFMTFTWLFVTSMFFFHGVNRVFPFFYASEPWLP